MATTEAFLTLLNYVREMRQAQLDYFRTRSRDSLIRSKQLEQAVDAQLVICQNEVASE